MDKENTVSAQNEEKNQQTGDAPAQQKDGTSEKKAEGEGGSDNGKDQGAEASAGSGEERGEGEAAGTEGVLPILTAVYPILYLSHQYKVGDALPANDPGMVEAWVAAGTAVWMPAVPKSPKAKPRTAEPGITGQAVYSESGNGGALAGKVPRTNARKR